MYRAIAALILTITPALAETPMTAQEFETYSTGKTLYYGDSGAPYGAEQYLSGRRVIWRFLDDDCQTGRWYEQNGQICFVYSEDPQGPQCWSFFSGPTGLIARFENDPDATPLIEVEQSRDPLICPGPRTGV